jgi:DtxR family Mn-dependent transcriptional regulator
MILTQSIQDYLKAIYDLNTEEGTVSTSALAARLEIAPASVTGMLQRLAATEPALIIYRKHHGVQLTPAGERAALEVIRHHRLLETYLVDALGYTWDEVHDEACRLEHAISESLEARIAEHLGNPARDPHGAPIPTLELAMPLDRDLPLSVLRPPQSAAITRVHDEDPALLRQLENLGLKPGSRLTILDFTESDENLRLQVEDQSQPVVLGPAITNQIFVEVFE